MTNEEIETAIDRHAGVITALLLLSTWQIAWLAALTAFLVMR